MCRLPWLPGMLNSQSLHIRVFVWFTHSQCLSGGHCVKAVTNCISSSSTCMFKGFSCSFLDLTVRQSPQGLSCDIFDKHSQPECAGI
jgi:hypothetical protein